MVTIALMPAPIPWSDLQGPCATSLFWEDAAEVMRRHTHHFLVAIVGVETDPLHQRLLLTGIVSVVSKLCDAVGIYWGDGTLVHDPDMFVEMANSASLEDLPIPLWVDIRLEEEDDGSLRCFTTGMRPLGFCEIEVSRSRLRPDDLYDLAAAAAGYVIENRLQIPAGQTFGRSEDERYAVVYGPSMFPRNGEVMQLTLRS